MTTDTQYLDWIIKENTLLADGNPQRFIAIPPANSRFHRKSFPTLEAARASIDRRIRNRTGGSSDDELLKRMLAARREVKILRQKLDAAITAALAAKRAFLAQDQMGMPE